MQSYTRFDVLYVHTIEDEVDQVRMTLDTKRHLLELLSVLEKKEGIRVDRVQEVKSLLHSDPRYVCVCARYGGCVDANDQSIHFQENP
jgi:hypothetical protein